MVITLERDLETALMEAARRQGMSPEILAINALRERFLLLASKDEPRDEWERRLRQIATNCGVALSDEAVSSEGIYE